MMNERNPYSCFGFSIRVVMMNMVTDPRIITLYNQCIVCGAFLSSRAIAQIHVPPPANNDVTFNLNEESFYLFLAKGPLNEDNKIGHHEVKAISPAQINLAESKIISKMTQGAQIDSIPHKKI